MWILVNLGGLVWLLLRPAADANPAAAATAPSAASGAPTVGAPAAAGATPQLAPGERLIGPAASGAPPSVAIDGNVPPLVGADDGPVAGDGPIAGDANPADFLPAEAARRSARSGAAVRNYADVSNAVPPLRLDLHVYDASPSLRYAFINMKKLREGEATADGARVLEITRDGVLVNYRGTEFLLTSDSSATAGSALPGADSR